MATTTRTRAPTSTKRKNAAPRNPSGANRANSTSKAGTKKAVGNSAGGFMQAIRARPYAAAAIAAGAAGASAFLWAKRAFIGEQASAAGEKLTELRDQASEQATVLKGKVSDRLFASDEGMDSVSAAKAERMNSRGSDRSQSDIAAEALSLKQIGEPTLAEQSKVGAVAY